MFRGGSRCAVAVIVGAIAWPVAGTAEIFVTSDNSVRVFPDIADGDFPAIRGIFRDFQPMSDVAGLALDLPRRELYVVDTDSVNVFSMDADGEVVPLRTLSGSETGFVAPRGIALDEAHNELYVADSDAQRIFVFPRTASGDQAPAREIGGASSFEPNGHPSLVFLDLVHDELFVSVRESGDARVLVFDRTASGDATPKRTLSGLDNPRSVVVDLKRDELFVTEYDGGQILVFDRTAQGDASAKRTITTPSGEGLEPYEAVLVDGGELLVGRDLAFDGQVVGIPADSDGEVAPGRVLQGPATLLAYPIGVVSSRAEGCSADRAVDACVFRANFASGSICSAGWSALAGSAEACPVCGNGIQEQYETCDDNNTTDGNGCSSACIIEHGFQCTGSPSVCSAVCGDGIVAGTEGCDDGGTSDGNGCSASCDVELGWICNGEPSLCDTICGDGIIVGDEQCDDLDTEADDGCSPSCDVEPGWQCNGTPSVCTPI